MWEAGAHAREDTQTGKMEKMVKDTVGGFKDGWDRERKVEQVCEWAEHKEKRQIKCEEHPQDCELLVVTIKTTCCRRSGHSTGSISALVSAAEGHNEDEDSSSKGAGSSAILD